MDINKCGTTVIMVTHEHDLVQYFGGRIINLKKGQVVFDDFIAGRLAPESAQGGEDA
jgi:cell division transport system ATP-binding protein